MLPLQGITVVALEQAIAVPFATRQLADLGARVIKIERPGVGDFARHYDRTVLGLSSHFVWANRSKESLTLNLKHPEAGNILSALVACSDVFMQNLAPGATDRLGFGAAALRETYPRLIVCDVSGYGSTGPYREKKAYDLLVQCETGLPSVTGTPETPSRVGISIADIASAMYAVSGTLLALYRRERTGEGCAFEVSMFEALGEWMSFPALYTAYGGSPPPRTGASHATIYPYGAFTAGDGRTVFLGLQNEREWIRFCDLVLRRPELASDSRFGTNPDRVANRDALKTIIENVLNSWTADAVVERLEVAGIANAHLNTPQEFWDHPQLTSRDRFRNVTSSAGIIRSLIPPITMPETEWRMDPIPEVGEHTDAILQSLDYSIDHITRLRAEGAI